MVAALKRLAKKMKGELELHRRSLRYEKPSERKRRRRKDAIHREKLRQEENQLL